MYNSVKFQKIARSIVIKIIDEVTNLLTKNRYSDPYYDLEQKIANELSAAYQDGFLDGRKSITDALKQFDNEKDQLES